MANRAADGLPRRQAPARARAGGWLLSAPALLIVVLRGGRAAAGHHVIYSFLVKGDYGDVKSGQFSIDGWFSVFLQRDIFDDTITTRRRAPRHLLALGQAVGHAPPS